MMVKKIAILFLAIVTLLGCSVRPEIAVQPTRTPIDEARPLDRVTLSVIGDIMVHGAQLNAARDEENNEYHFEPVFSQVKELLSRADVTIGNLETTLPGRETLYSGYPQFGAPDAIATALRGAGIDILVTANNHACDKGKRGVVRTIKVLDEVGLLHVGTYQDQTAYDTRRILIVERNHIRLAVLNYTYGVNDMPIPQGTFVGLIDRQQIADDIALARAQQPDCIIVFIHWGTEYERYPNEFQKTLAASLFSEGADIVLGSHPHVMQPYVLQSITDKYGATKPRLVIYSLGNFVSNQRERYRDGGIIFNITLEKQYSRDKGATLHITDVHYIPTWVYAHRTAPNNQFYVLPVRQYLKNDQPLQLPDEAYQKLLTFYQDTTVHLEPKQSSEKAQLKPQPRKGVITQ
jgi:poly-gamma-glutamate capsule biosynthesis protein CapA/YwtB (metallophosphatase superfamily)